MAQRVRKLVAVAGINGEIRPLEPAHKGLREPGSELLAELIKTYNPRLALVGGAEPAQEDLARTLVVCPGRLDNGHYAVVDLGARSVEAATLTPKAAVGG
jgi:Icc-related predicted phosphoesterase